MDWFDSMWKRSSHQFHQQAQGGTTREFYVRERTRQSEQSHSRNGRYDPGTAYRSMSLKPQQSTHSRTGWTQHGKTSGTRPRLHSYLIYRVHNNRLRPFFLCEINYYYYYYYYFWACFDRCRIKSSVDRRGIDSLRRWRENQNITDP